MTKYTLSKKNFCPLQWTFQYYSWQLIDDDGVTFDNGPDRLDNSLSSGRWILLIQNRMKVRTLKFHVQTQHDNLIILLIKYATPKICKCKILVRKILTIQHPFIRLFHHQIFALYCLYENCLLYNKTLMTSALLQKKDYQFHCGLISLCHYIITLILSLNLYDDSKANLIFTIIIITFAFKCKRYTKQQFLSGFSLLYIEYPYTTQS